MARWKRSLSIALLGAASWLGGLPVEGRFEHQVMAAEQAEVAGSHEVSGAAGGQHAEGAHGDAAHADASHADASSASSDHGGMPSPVSVNPDLAIVTAIIFLILLAVLGKFAWRPIVAAIDAREHGVAQQLADAKRAQEEAARLLAEHEKKLAGATLEVKQLLDQARQDADRQKQSILDSAQAAAASEKDRAIREIHAAKNAALQDLARKSVDTAVDLAGKLVKRQLTTDDHSQLVGDALQRFSQNN